ncbi:RING finger protein Etp1p [Trichomonascus vanleenenianus]|uniref:RING finger protein Etp1p n=1 Tax=Trichomonascus vanleenenianus TaxID=2268995 RepID=UPI003EC9A8BB
MRYHLVIDLESCSDSQWSRSVVDQQDLFLSPTGQASGVEWDPCFRERVREFRVAQETYTAGVGPGYYRLNASDDWRLSDIEIMSYDRGPDIGWSHTGAVKGRYLGKGVVRLFRDVAAPQEDGGAPHAAHAASSSEAGSSELNDVNDQTVLAVLAVPSYFSPSDVLGFVGQKTQDNVSHIRMIKAEASGRFMVLFKFRDSEGAQEFYSEFNGRLFNSMESELCHIVYVSAIEFDTQLQHRAESDDTNIPYLLEDQFTRRPDPPPQAPLQELPTCPVCLERMDTANTGLLTILCQHTFHCQCLQNWADGSCPVCRYSQSKAKKVELTGAIPLCAVCKSRDNLWMCLICGHVGCGRYDQAHAFDHYTASGHCYSLDVTTQRVWDYAADQYVHRLIQTESDGKLVELPQQGAASSSSVDVSTGGKRSVDKEKLEEIGMHYSSMLSSQLESQRMYYEALVNSAADRVSEVTAQIDELQRHMSELRLELQHSKIREKDYEESEQQLKSRAESSRTKVDKLQDMYSELLKSYKAEKLMSENAIAKLDKLEADKSTMAQETEELRQQVNDLMFYLDAQEKLKDAGEDVREGQVVVKKKNKKKKK